MALRLNSALNDGDHYSERSLQTGSVYRTMAARRLQTAEVFSYPDSIDIDELKSGTAYVVVRDSNHNDIAHLELAPDAWAAFKRSIIEKGETHGV
jgi:hypothetical protein